MAASRFFEWFQFAVFVCWGLLGLTRALLLRSRGVDVIVVDRQRTPSQMVVDAVAAIGLLVWAYEVVAYAWTFRFHVGPAGWHQTLIESVPVRTLGMAMVSLAVLLYAIAIRRLGESWRLGIDRATPGPLVTDGIYRWTRHPIYVAFDLLFVGTFLVLGSVIFLVLAVVWIPLLHGFMLREERFLTQRYGDAYRAYCRRVGRYFSWRRKG